MSYAYLFKYIVIGDTGGTEASFLAGFKTFLCLLGKNFSINRYFCSYKFHKNLFFRFIACADSYLLQTSVISVVLFQTFVPLRLDSDDGHEKVRFRIKICWQKSIYRRRLSKNYQRTCRVMTAFLFSPPMLPSIRQLETRYGLQSTEIWYI
jgi:hypothetical protein